MKKQILVGWVASAVALATVGTGLALAEAEPLPSGAPGVEGCAVIEGTGLATTNSCTYTPTVPGGMIGNHLQVTISGFKFVTNPDGTISKVNYSATISGPSATEENCVLWTPAASGARYTNVTSVTAGGADLLASGVVGNPYPSPSPMQLGPAC